MRRMSMIRSTAAFVLAAGFASVPTHAHAHTELDFSLPTDGASVAEPVDAITIGFTTPVTLIGPGFRVLMSTGVELTPFVVTDDDTVFRMQLDPPLAGGIVTVSWEVAAEDGHPRSGAFSFNVDAAVVDAAAPVALTSTLPPTTLDPRSISPATTVMTTRPTPISTGATVTPSTDDASGVSPGGDDEAGGRNDLYVAIAAVVAIAAGTVVVVRSGAMTRAN